MKPNQRLVLSSAVIGVALSILGIGLSGVSFGNAQTSTTSESGSMLGHIIFTVYDPNGSVKAYVQTDNLVIDQGEACAVKRVFLETATGSTDCGGSTTGEFNVIGLGTGAGGPTDNDVSLATETAAAGLARLAASSVTITDDATGTAGAKATLTRAFTNTSGGLVTITESGLFNSTTISGDGMFARQLFTGIPVADADTLTVTWNITFDGA